MGQEVKGEVENNRPKRDSPACMLVTPYDHRQDAKAWRSHLLCAMQTTPLFSLQGQAPRRTSELEMRPSSSFHLLIDFGIGVTGLPIHFLIAQSEKQVVMYIYSLRDTRSNACHGRSGCKDVSCDNNRAKRR